MPTSPSLFNYPSFIKFCLGRVATTMGNQMMMVAVGWQMYDLTHSAWDLGLVGLVQFIPSLALTLIVGHIVDRYDRRRILAACLFAQALIVLGFVWGTWAGWISREFILVGSLALGVSRAFQLPTQQALTPLLVPAEVLSRALAMASAGGQFATISGPALGGFFYVAGAAAVYLACGVLFALATAAILAMKLDHAPTPRTPVTLQSLFAGISFIWQRKVILGAISLDLFAVLLGGATALLPMFAKDILHVGPWGLGLLRAAPAAGALVVSVWLTRHPLTRNVGKIMFASVAVYGLCMVGFALSSLFALSFIVLLISGGADMVSVVVRQALVQLETPDEMRGRVSAVNSVFIGASNQLGEFESGTTAAWFGAIPSVLLGGLGTLLVVAIWMRLFPPLVSRQKLTADPVTGN